jgi:hypothetical protein
MTAPLDSYPRWAREALGYQQLWRRLGFEPDEMHIVSQGKQVAAVLQSQGLTFTALCGNGDGLTEVSFAAIWNRVCERVNASRPDDREVLQVIDRSVAWRHRVEVLASMHAKGFTWPAADPACTAPHGGTA